MNQDKDKKKGITRFFEIIFNCGHKQQVNYESGLRIKGRFGKPHSKNGYINDPKDSMVKRCMYESYCNICKEFVRGISITEIDRGKGKVIKN